MMSNPTGFTWLSWNDTQDEALASQRRGESEDLHAERMREIEEIDDDMKTLDRGQKPRHADTLNTAFDVDEDLHFDILNDEEFNY